jgi:ribose 1,5-bisphosphokinase
LPRSIDDEIASGRTVVANVSRTVIAALRRAYANVVVVSVTAPMEVLAARLVARGRASDGPINARLNRSTATAQVVADIVIDNVGPAEIHAPTLLDVVSTDGSCKRGGDS